MSTRFRIGNFAFPHQRLAIQTARQAGEHSFTACGDDLNLVKVFKCLGRPLSVSDSDWPALHKNLAKTRQRWAQVSPLLAREGANPRVSAMFYKAVVMSTLLHGAESWVITPSMWTALNGFHHKTARRIAGKKPCRKPDGSWVHPPIEDAYRVTGLLPLSEYVARRRRTIATYIKERPVYHLCQQSNRMSGTPTRTLFWWEQPDLGVD